MPPTAVADTLFEYVRAVVLGLVPEDLQSCVSIAAVPHTARNGRVATLSVYVSGSEQAVGRVVGKRGATLGAIQLLARNAAAARGVYVDVVVVDAKTGRPRDADHLHAKT